MRSIFFKTLTCGVGLFLSLSGVMANQPTPASAEQTMLVSTCHSPHQDDESPSAKEWEVLNKLDISPLQKELLTKYTKEMDERLQDFPGAVGAGDEAVAKGNEFNKWKRKSLREILTRDQYARLFKLWGSVAPANELGPVPKLPPIERTVKTEEAIMHHMQLSAKQEEHFKKQLAARNKANLELRKKPSPEAAEKISQNWRAALDHILTKEQRKQYSQFWGSPDRVGG